MAGSDPRTRTPLRSTHNRPPIKNPQTEMTSAAGKCLRKMDLPLARYEPSPPYRLRETLRLARQCPIALPKPHPIRSLIAQAARARFEFVGRTHRKRIHPKQGSRTSAAQPSIAKRKQLPGRLAVARAVISPPCSKVKQRMTLRRIILRFLFCVGYLVAGKSMSLGTLPSRRHSST